VSIVTKTGDNGTTSLMYGRRVPKTHVRIEAFGAVDELNAALGVARASVHHDFAQEALLSIQKDLVPLMGEMATLTEDMPRYLKDGFSVVASEMTAKLEKLVKEIEARGLKFQGWATPGANAGAAALDMARVICRKAERRVCSLIESSELQNQEIQIYLNRLSDLLWLLARWVESKSLQQPK